MAKRENHHTRIAIREQLYAEQGGKCYYCGRLMKKKGEGVSGATVTLDHIIPVIEMEESSDTYKDNHVAACMRCNKAKGNFIVFTCLYDRLVYPVIETPFFFRASYIQENFLDDNMGKRREKERRKGKI